MKIILFFKNGDVGSNLLLINCKCIFLILVLILEKVDIILKLIPTIKKTIVFSYNKDEQVETKKFINFNEVLDYSKLDETFERFEFNHPIYILYSSGTTGKPKCITHGTGNVLIEHNKEFILHCDVKDNDKLFYY